MARSEAKTVGESWIASEFENAGKKLDMGKSCIRFRKLENIPLDVIGKVAAAQGVDEFISIYKKGRERGTSRKG